MPGVIPPSNSTPPSQLASSGEGGISPDNFFRSDVEAVKHLLMWARENHFAIDHLEIGPAKMVVRDLAA